MQQQYGNLIKEEEEQQTFHIIIFPHHGRRDSPKQRNTSIHDVICENEHINKGCALFCGKCSSKNQQKECKR